MAVHLAEQTASYGTRDSPCSNNVNNELELVIRAELTKIYNNVTYSVTSFEHNKPL